MTQDPPNVFSIDGRKVGAGHPCLIIAEIAQAHDGSLGTAHAYIDAVARAGVDAVKFQTHIAEAESTPGEPFRVHFSKQDASRFDYWKRMEFEPEHWQGLADHAREAGLIFLSSAFSMEAVDLLEDLHVPAWKVGAGEVTNTPLLKKMARTGKPVLLSSGMSTWEELERALAAVNAANAPVGVFQCTTAYPCPPEKLGLNVINELADAFGVPVGLSDHSGNIFAGLAAVTLGANMIEIHAVLSRDSFGPDVSSSLTIQELTQLVQGVRFIEAATSNPVSKNAMADSLEDLRLMFGKSIVAARDLDTGAILSMDNLSFKKPGTGIPAHDVEVVVGHVLTRPLLRNEMISHDDFQ